MTPINNSDTTWLIVTDYNQDNDLPYEELREDVYNPAINQWCYESSSQGVGGVGYISDVGVGGVGVGDVGIGYVGDVGIGYVGVGYVGVGGYVGSGYVGYGGVGGNI